MKKGKWWGSLLYAFGQLGRVGAELVTLMRRLQSTEHGERVAQVTRNVRVSGLSHCAMLPARIGEWRAETEEQCQVAGIALHWRADEASQEIALTPCQFINLTRILREGVTNLEMDVVHADSVASGRATLTTHPLNMALVDIGLPDGFGIELLRQIRENAPHITVSVMALFADDVNLFDALRAGAQGYLLKSSHRNKYWRNCMRGKPGYCR